MKTCIPLLLLLVLTIHPGRAQYSGKSFTITVGNGTFFTLHAEGHPDEGEGIFYKHASYIQPDKSFTYEIKNTNVFKGVEGHLKLKASKDEVPGGVDIYFDNPAVGSMKYSATADWPYVVRYVVPPREDGNSIWVEIKVDTTKSTTRPVPLKGQGSSSPKPNPDELIPPVINFDWEVTQRLPKEDDDEKNGKGYKNVTYFFTSSGDYAAVKPEDKSFTLMIYSPKGHTWIFDDKKKTITVMSMHKTVGEGGAMGKEIAEKIKKEPIAKDKEPGFSVSKTGKTKTILGLYKAEEFEIKNTEVIGTSKKAGTMSFWYVTVPFDPVKIYTMGAGRPADMSKIQNDPKMKRNPAAIPLLNKNYLWVETEGGGIKGLETIEIQKRYNTIYTAGYKIKVMNSLKDMLKGDDDN